MRNRRLDQATFQALQALIARGQLQVSAKLAAALRKRRTALRVSVSDLAERCGMETKAVQEIEKGARAISAPMLVQLSKVLDVDLVWFIEQEPQFFASAKAGRPADTAGKLLSAKEGLELIHAFAAIKDPTARKAVLTLAQTFAAREQQDKPPGKK